MRMFDAATGSKIRNLVRVLLVLGTAFGLKLSADKVAAIQAAAEAILALAVKDRVV